PRAVRAHDHGHTRLEANLDRLGERLEAAQLDGAKVHAPGRLARSPDYAASSAMSRICSLDIVPTMSWCLSCIWASTLVTSSSSLSPRTVAPHGQFTCFAISASCSSAASLSGIGPDENRVGDEDDLVRRQTGSRRVFADLVRARGLVDADRAEPSVLLRHD